MATRKYPPVDLVRQLFRYEDGKLFWLARERSLFASDNAYRTWNTRFAGKEAGSWSPDRSGAMRCYVGIYSRLFARSLVVWVIHHGGWPSLEVDHKDRDTTNDRLDNLRLATRSQNSANRRCRPSASGYKGVKRTQRSNRWHARIRVNGKLLHLGQFDSAEEAHAAYVEAAKRHFGEFACDGSSR